MFFDQNDDNSRKYNDVENPDQSGDLCIEEDSMGVSGGELMLPIITLRNTIFFPGDCVPLLVGRAKSVDALQFSYNSSRNKKVFLVAQPDESVEEPDEESMYRVGVVAYILQVIKLPDSSIKTLLKIESRAFPEKVSVEDNSFFVAKLKLLPDPTYSAEDEENIYVLHTMILKSFEAFVVLDDNKISQDTLVSINDLKDPLRVAYAIIMHLSIKQDEKQKILSEDSVISVMETVYMLLQKSIKLLTIEKSIKDRIRSQMETTQKTYYLNEQMKAIMKELGEGEHVDANDLSILEKKVNALKIDQESKEKVLSELSKLKIMSPMSAEASVLRGYLDWILDIPFEKYSKSEVNIEKAEEILNKNHYGLEKVKERIIEYLAVMKRTSKTQGSIICLVGPPGVGKTSLVSSVASALDRPFVRMALGGVRDESEIRGHRRTYIGALPGRIVQNLKKAKKMNPVFLLDEIDKIRSDYRGDPAFALLEVLDPDHNHHFVDNYIEISIDLSSVMFIATANDVSEIPRPLFDRLEIIYLPGYTEYEKLKIARNHLIKSVGEEHGIAKGELSISDFAVKKIINEYTKESGVRGLRREIANLARKALTSIIRGKAEKLHVGTSNLSKYAGVSKFSSDDIVSEDLVGVVAGLAYTAYGGKILYVEVVKTPGKGTLKYTGTLGDVMKESIQMVHSYIGANCMRFGFTTQYFKKHDVHVHVPEGATPKDGPSAGVTVFTAIISLFTDIPVKRSVAMTGEVSLRGQVMEIGGLKEKMLAASRTNIDTVLIPKSNEKDIQEVEKYVLKHSRDIKIITVGTVEDVMEIALVKKVISLDEDVLPDDTKS
ncbi:MAG: ATP-dependent protease La [Candidatus Xenolissoclinum pacificiensis L6]|uniref:Lon protease n=1 Tax=Candidatus Xenolissoclinum pacificiensis L6 TaxID=1401685 RepID=W2V271_9RICK|nr:MAG: ATP-dependent protease La [Candidatus Xenolissoclinum pacificiensis L6]